MRNVTKISLNPPVTFLLPFPDDYSLKILRQHSDKGQYTFISGCLSQDKLSMRNFTDEVCMILLPWKIEYCSEKGEGKSHQFHSNWSQDPKLFKGRLGSIIAFALQRTKALPASSVHSLWYRMNASTWFCSLSTAWKEFALYQAIQWVWTSPDSRVEWESSGNIIHNLFCQFLLQIIKMTMFLGFFFSSKNNAYEMSPGCGNLCLYTEPNNTHSNCLYSFLFHKSYSGKGIIRNFQDNQSSASSALDFFDGLRMLVCSLCGDNVLVCLLTIKLFIVSLFRQAAIKQ